MLIIDRTQRTWAALSIVICAAASGVYVVYSTNALNGPSGGSLPGLVFGIIAAAMMIFAGLLAARRRFPAARLGSAQFWLRGHLWIGALTVPFALFHAGFGWGGRLELLLWLLFFAVILSGFWGLALQQILPRMMLEQIPRETFVEQIPHLCLRFSAEADRLLADNCGPLEVPLSPKELSLLQPYLLPYFEEDRKKNRTDYPKTASEVEQFQIFLAKIYAGVKSAVANGTPVVPSNITASILSPTVKSVAHNTLPAATDPVDLPVINPTSEPAAKAKPDPKAILAALKAKKAAEAAVTVTVEAPQREASQPIAPHIVPAEQPAVPGKPDPKAMLAAMKAKKEAAAVLTSGATSSNIEKTSPVIESKLVRAPSADGESHLPSAVKVVPPSVAQITELKQFYLELIRPLLPWQPATRDWMDAIRRATLACHVRQDVLHPQFVPVFNRLYEVCEQRRQFAFVLRYHRWLHGWLLVHIPATVALYVILVVHAVSALRVIPFGN